jgi:hypothetical protein
MATGAQRPVGVPHQPGASGKTSVLNIAAAVVRSQQPFEHGWWLAAYLALVGALSQFLLVSGQRAFVRTRC